MGVQISFRQLVSQETNGLLKPIVYCGQYFGDSAPISVNANLAGELLSLAPSRRTMQIERCLSIVISKLPANPVIKDFDALFNPAYQVDVLKIMVNICKQTPFSIIWPGKVKNDKLVYAEEGYRDYREYPIDSYDITCVI